MFFTKLLHWKEKREKIWSYFSQILALCRYGRPLRPREPTPSGAAELLLPFSCFYLELVQAYPLKVLDFVLLCLSSPGAELGRAGRLCCAAKDVEEERLIGRPGGGREVRRLRGRKESISLGKKKKK